MSLLSEIGKFALEVVRLCAASGLSALLTIKIVNRVKARSDHSDKRIDDMVNEVRAVADLASDYWLKKQSEGSAIIEARISSRARLLSEMRVLAGAYAPELMSEVMEKEAGKFVRALTGGDFGVHSREPSIDTARGCQHAASRYIGALRRARSDALQG